MSIEPGPEHRERLRSNVFLTAQLRDGAGSFVVRVRNISASGAMLDGAELPQKGSTVRLDRGHLAVTGRIVWQSGEARGIRFDTNIQVDEWVKRVGHAGQRQVDKAIDAVRRGNAIVDNQGPRRTLNDLGKDLRQICEQMTLLPNFSVELGESLLKIESIALELERLDGR